MSNWEDQYTSHPIHAQLNTILELCAELDEKFLDKESQQTVDRIGQAVSAIRRRAELSDPLITPTAALDHINTQMGSLHSQLSAYKESSNPQQLVKATNHLNSALTQVSQLAYPQTIVDDDTLRPAVDRFTSIVEDLTTRIESAIADQESRVADATSVTESLRAYLSEIEAQIRTEKERVDSVISDFQKTSQEREDSRTDKFNAALAKFDSEFSKLTTTLSKESEVLGDELKEQIAEQEENYSSKAKEIIDQLEDLRSQASNLVHVIGNIGVTGNYQLIASGHEKSANSLRNGAVALFLSMGFLVIYTALKIDDIDWQVVLFRLTGALILAVPAAYLARESSRHRDLATRNRKIELEMASLEPFIETLNDEEKRQIKKDLTSKYFGQKEQVPLDKDSIPAGPFMDVVKVLIKAFGEK